MISVTVAAHGKGKRCVGSHLRAYGSGRLSICDLDRKTLDKKATCVQPQRLWEKLRSLIVSILQFCFPALFRFLYMPINPNFKLKKFPADMKSTCIPYAPIHQLPSAILARIFTFLDCDALLCCELTSKKWRAVIEENLDVLPKQPTDQIRILFDEAEVFIYPVDSRKCPVRYNMPSLQILERRLRHLTTQSLFIRGLIPVESAPVFRSLLSLALRPQQVYFIWSKFSPLSIPMFEKFLWANRESVVDLGLEECSPPQLFTDELLEPLLPGLTCVRLWNNGKSGNYAVSDFSIYKLADAIADGYPVETVDLASCGLTESSLLALILAWVRRPLSDLCISLNYCLLLNKTSLLELLSSHDVFLTDSKLRKNGFCLTLFC